MKAMLAAVGNGAAAFGQHFVDIAHELAAARLTGERALVCTAAALSVALAVTLAQAASLDNPWWAGISGLVASQATRPASIARSILRIIGTAIGTGLGCVAIALFAYDHVALCLFLFAVSSIAMLGFSVSPHSYAWLLGGLNATIIVIMAMDDPSRTPFIAFDRLAEVALGCVAAVLVALALAPGGEPAAAAVPPGWRDLLGAGWPAVQHAVRCGIAVVVVLLIWNFLDLPSLSQIAITVTAVMAVPVTAANDRLDMRGIVTGRAIQRLIGCLLGGVLGLLCLGMQLTSHALWLLVLFGGVWICVHVQASKAAISYAGNQAAIVFIVTIAQGFGPPTSILPGIDRFAGILGGLAVLLVLGLVLWPGPEAEDPAR